MNQNKKSISENPDRLTVDGEKRRLGLFGWFLEAIFENVVENYLFFELKYWINLNFESFFLKQLWAMHSRCQFQNNDALTDDDCEDEQWSDCWLSEELQIKYFRSTYINNILKITIEYFKTTVPEKIRHVYLVRVNSWENLEKIRKKWWKKNVLEIGQKCVWYGNDMVAREHDFTPKMKVFFV